MWHRLSVARIVVPREPFVSSTGIDGRYPHAGRVAERTKATVLKTVRGESPSRVRIPVLPQMDRPLDPVVALRG
jgi:hypothetical protein